MIVVMSSTGSQTTPSLTICKNFFLKKIKKKEVIHQRSKLQGYQRYAEPVWEKRENILYESQSRARKYVEHGFLFCITGPLAK